MQYKLTGKRNFILSIFVCLLALTFTTLLYRANSTKNIVHASSEGSIYTVNEENIIDEINDSKHLENENIIDENSCDEDEFNIAFLTENEKEADSRVDSETELEITDEIISGQEQNLLNDTESEVNSESFTGYASGDINVRQSPNGSQIGYLNVGTKVEGILTNNWVETTYNGETGYVYAPLLQKDPIYMSTYVQAGSNLRELPNGTIIQNTELPIYIDAVRESDWLKFYYNNETCYVHLSRTQTSSPAVTGYASGGVNVRESPNGSRIGYLNIGTKVEGILINNWVEITYNGETGYVYAPLLQKDSPYTYVYLDVGHGGHDSGAYYSGVKESNLNLIIARQVKDRLEKLGYKVLMPRNADFFIDLIDRAIDANTKQPDIFVSIHHNAHPNALAANGIETYYYQYYSEYPPQINGTMHLDPLRIKQSRELAESIHRELIAQTNAVDRGVQRNTFLVLRETSMPSVLLELGFMSNYNELRNLQAPSYQTKLVNGIVDGIHYHFTK